jgi:hypothetical protein
MKDVKIHLPRQRGWCLLTVAVALYGLTLLASCGGDDPVTPVATNHAPAAPAIDTTAGTPADGATGTALSPSLNWTCSDQDGDDLTYTVHFGSAAAPPVVAADQAGVSYDPPALEFETQYFWQIVAADPAGETAASPVWSFTTLAAGVETVSTPAAPNGPETGFANQPVGYSALGAASSEAHDLEYRFDWDGGDICDWGTASRLQIWVTAGTYEVKAQARCVAHPDILSAWSLPDTITVAGPETVSTPNVPAGPATGLTTETIRFDVTGAASSYGHAVDIRFDWGNGIITAWTAADWGATRWPTPGQYEVRVQARCHFSLDILSAWSAPAAVTIAAPAETIDPIGAGASGPDNGALGEVQTFTVIYPADSSLGHAVQYQFDWGDGSYSDWSAALAGLHAWSAVGTYTVRVQARCVDHPGIVSTWVSSSPIEITDASETITGPTSVQALGQLVNGRQVNLVINGAISNYGDELQYRLDLDGDGISAWQDLANIPYTFTVTQSYSVRAQARCKLHPDVVSDWSPVRTVIIIESVTGVQAPTEPATGLVNTEITFATLPAVSSDGHPLEYNFYYAGTNWNFTGPQSGWDASLTRSYTYTTAGQKIVRVQARCIEHPTAIGFSSYHVLTISNQTGQ